MPGSCTSPQGVKNEVFAHTENLITLDYDNIFKSYVPDSEMQFAQ